MSKRDEYVLVLRKVIHQVANYANYVARRLQRQGLLVAIDVSENFSPPDSPPAVSLLLTFRLVSAEKDAMKNLRKYAYDKSGKSKRLAKEEEEALKDRGKYIEVYERGDQDQGAETVI